MSELPTGSSTPTVLRIILARRLKELRLARDVSLKAASKALGTGELTVRRIENAQVGLKTLYVKELLRLYEVPADEAAEFLEMAERANQPGWWHPFRDALPTWFRAYVSLESGARLLRTYEPHYVTGILQTRDYSRAVMRAGFPNEPEDELERRVDIRLRRQDLLERSERPTIWVVMEETSLRRVVGGPEVMRGQIEHLLEAMDLPELTIRVLPLGAGPHTAAAGHFTYFRFDEPELQDIVYTEGLTSASYLDEPEDVTTHLEAHIRASRLAHQHLPDLRGYLQRLHKEYGG